MIIHAVESFTKPISVTCFLVYYYLQLNTSGSLYTVFLSIQVILATLGDGGQSCGEKEYRHGGICCEKCRPGQYVKTNCSATNPTTCESCKVYYTSMHSQLLRRSYSKSHNMCHVTARFKICLSKYSIAQSTKHALIYLSRMCGKIKRQISQRYKKCFHI